MQRNLSKNISDQMVSGYRNHIHYDEMLERAVLGACLLEKDAFARIYKLVEPEHFYGQQNAMIMRTLTEMWADGKVIDLITVNLEIHQSGRHTKFFDIPQLYIMQLTNEVVSTAHLEHHALYLREMFAKRELIRIQSEAGAGNDDTLIKIIEMQEQLSRVLSVRSTDDWLDMSRVMLGLNKHMDDVRGKDILGVPTGFPTLDTITSGLIGTELVVIGARPSVGKTAFASGLIVNAARKGYTVGVINLEMPHTQVGARLLSYDSGIEFWRIFRAKKLEGEEQRLFEAIATMGTLPIYISQSTYATASEIRSKAIKLRNKAGLGMLVIDYLQLIEGEGKGNETREREVARLSRALKMLALELNIPVLLLVQLNRDSEKSPAKMPRMSNIRESGAIEQDADKVILLHRDWKSGVEIDEQGRSTENQATIIIEKNRNGDCTRLQVNFHPDTMKFYEGDLFPSYTSQHFPTSKVI